MFKLFNLIILILLSLTSVTVHAVVLQKEIHYVRKMQSNKKIKKPAVMKLKIENMQTTIGYNKIQGFHKISAQPEHSSFKAQPSFPSIFSYSVKDKLVHFVKKTVSHLQHTKYKLGGRKFDTNKGLYILDCSIYVDNLLQEAHPEGLNHLIERTGNVLPTSLSYYNYFTGLKAENQYWDRVRKVANLQAGDILVFRNKRYRRNQAAGHIMVVMDKPKKSGSAYLVRVADSAPYRHSRDTRPARHSGIGIGTLLIRVDRNTGQPTAYAWSIGSKWKSNVRFAMARPLSV